MKLPKEHVERSDLEHLEDLVEDWDNFESHHAQIRDKRSFDDKKTNHSEKIMNWWKWLVASRYRAIYKDYYDSENT